MTFDSRLFSLDNQNGITIPTSLCCGLLWLYHISKHLFSLDDQNGTRIPISKLLRRLLASQYSSSSSRAALLNWYWCSVQLPYEDEATSSIERDIPYVAEI